MDTVINYNGHLLPEKQLCISVNNRSFRYGDGFFETIKVIDGKIILPHLHFTRLFSSLEKLHFDVPAFLTAEYLSTQILRVAEQNKHSPLARVRLTVFRGDGGLYDEVSNFPNVLIQTLAGSEQSNYLNKEGFELDFFNEAKKSCDGFSSVKGNSYLPSLTGSLYVKKNKLNDCVISNCFNRIAETTIANVFIIRDGVIKTPSLAEGCVDGVMRRYLINCFKKENFEVEEGEILHDELLQASEVFLTNAMYGIRWVKKVGSSNFSNQLSSILHQKFIEPLFGAKTF
jgi:branched-subunit amino acid aminotransferase/4-amino-4-deoxychorismate lyase